VGDGRGRGAPGYVLAAALATGGVGARLGPSGGIGMSEAIDVRR